MARLDRTDITTTSDRTLFSSPSSLQQLHKYAPENPERLSLSSRSESTQPSFGSQASDNQRLSTDHCVPSSQRTDEQRLQRIEAVRIQHSIRKYDHRYYVVHVYLRSPSIPIYRRDPDHTIETPFVTFFTLRDSIVASSRRHARRCASCSTRVAALRQYRESAHDPRRLVRTHTDKEERLEKFLHCLLGTYLDTQFPVAECDGCACSSRTLVAFLKRQYQPSTGII